MNNTSTMLPVAAVEEMVLERVHPWRQTQTSLCRLLRQLRRWLSITSPTIYIYTRIRIGDSKSYCQTSL
jgi:hypothetical protein